MFTTHIKNKLSIRTTQQFFKMFSHTAAPGPIKYETISVTIPKEFVYHVELNRPDKLNALNYTLWTEIAKCFQDLSEDENCRAVVLTGSGKLFCAGLDFSDAMKVGSELQEQEDVARKAKILKKYITTYQNSMSSLEICNKPVLAAVHSACIGGGINLITAADIRYCTKDAWFQIKEVELGMAADVGVLQRLPKIVGNDSWVREAAYTCHKINSDEAQKHGLVSKVFDNKELMVKEAIHIAEQIAKKSPVAVQGTKFSLIYGRDHSVQEGLQQMVLLNQAMLQSEDFASGTMSQITKDKNVVFSKL